MTKKCHTKTTLIYMDTQTQVHQKKKKKRLCARYAKTGFRVLVTKSVV